MNSYEISVEVQSEASYEAHTITLIKEATSPEAALEAVLVNFAGLDILSQTVTTL